MAAARAAAGRTPRSDPSDSGQPAAAEPADAPAVEPDTEPAAGPADAPAVEPGAGPQAGDGRLVVAASFFRHDTTLYLHGQPVSDPDAITRGLALGVLAHG